QTTAALSNSNRFLQQIRRNKNDTAVRQKEESMPRRGVDDKQSEFTISSKIRYHLRTNGAEKMDRGGETGTWSQNQRSIALRSTRRRRRRSRSGALRGGRGSGDLSGACGRQI
ncbi:hypothetical protein CRG98_025398, partial [Punica granatum]